MLFDNNITIMPVANGFIVSLPKKKGSGPFDANLLDPMLDKLINFKKDFTADDEVLRNIEREAEQAEREQQAEQKADEFMIDQHTFIFLTFEEVILFLGTRYRGK